MWAHVSGSLLLTGRGFGSGPPPWSFPEAITLIAPALPSVTSCDCSGAGRAAALSWKPFPFSELWLRGIGYCPAFEKETVHESSPDHGAGSLHGPNQHNPQLCPRDRMRLQCHLHIHAYSSEYGNTLCRAVCWKRSRCPLLLWLKSLRAGNKILVL